MTKLSGRIRRANYGAKCVRPLKGKEKVMYKEDDEGNNWELMRLEMGEDQSHWTTECHDQRIGLEVFDVLFGKPLGSVKEIYADDLRILIRLEEGWCAIHTCAYPTELAEEVIKKYKETK